MPELNAPDDAIRRIEERFRARRGERAWAMPIKGTRPFGAAAELLGSEPVASR